MDLRDGLNTAQADAMSITEGPLLVIAGPGSGLRYRTHAGGHRVQPLPFREEKLVRFFRSELRSEAWLFECLLNQCLNSEDWHPQSSC